MADDLSVKYTDKKTAQLEKKLRKVYSDAQKDIAKKLETFTEKSAAREKAYLQKVKDGTMTQEAFDHWKQGQVFYGENWKAQEKSIAKVLSNTNSVANSMINGEKADVFAFAGNYTGYEMEHGFGVNFGFDLYDEKSVERLIKDNPQILPKSRVSIPKDERWNMQMMRSQITQGLIQGESIPKIARRLSEAVPNSNRKQMVLHARTAMTGAQNAGRQARYDEAQEMGIKFKKVWVASLDSRTRELHQELDGQAVEPDEDFEVQGYKIAFPGDPSADPEMVYNCRCTMITKLDDYPAKFDRRGKNDDEDGYELYPGDMTYKEWADAKEGTEENARQTRTGTKTGTKENAKEQKAAELPKVTKQEASDDWFEYENAQIMREYIETGKVPTTDMYGDKIPKEEAERLSAEAQLMQDVGAKTKTEYKTLYRGMVLDEDEARAMFTPGEKYEFETLSASTTEKKLSAVYSNVENSAIENGVPVILEIQKPDGIYGFDRDGKEIVLPKGSEFTVKRNYMDKDGVVHISLYSKKGKNVK